MTFKEWIASEEGQRALEYAVSAPGAGLSMAWDKAICEAQNAIRNMTADGKITGERFDVLFLAHRKLDDLAAFGESPTENTSPK